MFTSIIGLCLQTKSLSTIKKASSSPDKKIVKKKTPKKEGEKGKADEVSFLLIGFFVKDDSCFQHYVHCVAFFSQTPSIIFENRCYIGYLAGH